jgi:hypothetical protein
MSPSPFTVVDDTVVLPPDPSADPATAVQQVWDAAREYWNTGAPADYDTLAGIGSLLSAAVA